MKQLIESIFDAFFKEVTIEDDMLLSLFRQNVDIYSKNMSYGVYILFETSFVYLCLRGCLRQKVPARIAWEQSYTSAKHKHTDIGVYVNDKPRALIEFKIWSREDDSEIIHDIAKYKAETEITSKWLIVLKFAMDIQKTEKYLRERIVPKSITVRQKSTNVILNGTREDIVLAFYLLEA